MDARDGARSTTESDSSSFVSTPSSPFPRSARHRVERRLRARIDGFAPATSSLARRGRGRGRVARARTDVTDHRPIPVITRVDVVVVVADTTIASH
jgi:hypothetical protein